MFIYAEWERFCSDVSSRFTCIRADQITAQPENASWVVIKHDVETNVNKALNIARIEAKYGITATYYVQSSLLKEGCKALQEIANLGHEVSYHYDVLDSNNGDLKVAISEFRETMSSFSSYGFDVKTVCPHGNPVMNRDGWSSNKDFFRDQEAVDSFPGILDIVVHLPDILDDDYLYISDAGYGWKSIANVHDNDVGNMGDEVLNNYSVMMEAITRSKKVIISSHPHRWEKTRLKALRNIIFFRGVRFLARRVLAISFMRNILSKYYYLAKKI